MSWDDVVVYDDGGPVVCTKHKRFLPCRREGSHTFSDVPGDIDAVREYQQSEIRKYNAERKS